MWEAASTDARRLGPRLLLIMRGHDKKPPYWGGFWGALG